MGILLSTMEMLMTSKQRAKKVLSDSPGLVDFAIGLVNSVINLPDGQVKFFWRIQITEELWNQSAHQNVSGASWNDAWASKCLSFSLPGWQAVKMIFFAPCKIFKTQVEPQAAGEWFHCKAGWFLRLVTALSMYLLVFYSYNIWGDYSGRYLKPPMQSW